MRTGGGRFEIGEKNEKKLVELYRAGYELDGLAKRFGITKFGVSDVIRRNAPEIARKRGRKEDYRDAI